MARPTMTIRGTKQFRDGPLAPLFSIPRLSYLGSERVKTPFGGEQWSLTYWSPASSSLSVPSSAEVAYTLVPAGFSARLTAFGPIHRLVVTTPDLPTGGTQGIQQTYYELLGNNVQLDLREHPKSIALGSAVVRTIDCVLSQSADPNISTSENQVVPQQSDIPAGDARELYDLLSQRNGNAAYVKPQFVFRYTRVASNFATGVLNYDNVEKILTTTQMISETGFPGTGILSAINSAVVATQPAAVDGYVYGWLKQTPTVTSMAGNKFQIVGDYSLEFWSTWIYEQAP
jgi:hypothetical protein